MSFWNAAKTKKKEPQPLDTGQVVPAPNQANRDWQKAGIFGQPAPSPPAILNGTVVQSLSSILRLIINYNRSRFLEAWHAAISPGLC